ncbi:MAG TPA: S4 domain-containing protein YaaA [Tissierellaceae bacterium]|nr:S4 domain-containing protein YaaA [Tissierellaceae bacterium]
MKEIKIETEYIKLDQFLKFAGLVQTGGQGKMIISEGNILVNNKSCTKRGKKLRKGDIIEIKGYESFIVI